MNLLFRVLYVILNAWRAPRIGILDESVLVLRVWPNDLDTNLHMNNGRYLTIMDLGRLDLMLRLGLFWPAVRRGWSAILGGATIRFRRSLDPFETFTLRSRIVGWDERWLYIEQRFEKQNGDAAAVAYVRGLLRAKERSIPSAEALTAFGFDTISPTLPLAVQAWIRSEDEMRIV